MSQHAIKSWKDSGKEVNYHEEWVGESQRGQKSPLVIWFAGMGHEGFQGLSPYELEPHTPMPFLMLAPLRQSDKRWFVSEDGESGWAEGEFDYEEMATMAAWINAMTMRPDVDRTMISIIGFSAGAYAATEILASGLVGSLHSVIVCGVQAHWQPDMTGMHGKQRLKRAENIQAKWRAYLTRLDRHVGARGHIGFFHDPADQASPYEHAEQIFLAVKARQEDLGFEPAWMDRDVTIDCANKNAQALAHLYARKIFTRPDILKMLCVRDAKQGRRSQPSAPMQSSRTCYGNRSSHSRSEKPEQGQRPFTATRGLRSRSPGQEDRRSRVIRDRRSRSREQASPQPPWRARVWTHDTVDAAPAAPRTERRHAGGRAADTGPSRRTRSNRPGLAERASASSGRDHCLVSMISARTGWFVDSLRFTMADGSEKSWGGDGGNEAQEEELRPGEYIKSVDQKNHHVGFLGSGLTFHLSSGRQIIMAGTGSKRQKSTASVSAEAGQQIYDLVFDGSVLAGSKACDAVDIIGN